MSQIIDRGYIGSNLPWAGSGSAGGGDKSHGNSLEYRGWVLVDLLNGRYARKGLDKVRVCRLHTPQHDAIAEFHRVVDEIEDGGCHVRS